MEFIGFSKKTTKWFKYHLSNRKLKVYIKNTFSKPGNLKCAVPEGFIPRPLLFLLYINDTTKVADWELLLYADDTCLTFQYKDIIEIETALNTCFVTGL